MPLPSPDSDPRRWRQLALLAFAELFGMSLWLAAAAVGPQLAARWQLSASETGWLVTIVQFGFVLGTAVSAVLNLADVIPSKRLFAVSALIGAAANAALVHASTYQAALALRLVTGFALAGVYPPAMKMIATWFRSQRGLGIGTIVGALTIGKASPYLVHAFPGAGTATVLFTVSGFAVLGAAIVTVGYDDGPYAFPSRPFSWSLVGTVFRVRRWRLATGGYLGHMFELYSMWTWIPVFLAASAAASGMAAGPRTNEIASLVSFLAIAAGGAGCIWGGLVADRRGREWLVTVAMAASGACAVLIGFTFGHALWLTGAVAVVWGFFVVADSAQFSTLVTEAVPPHSVGTALSVQTSVGFLLTMVSIQLVPPAQTALGWHWALAILAFGPAFGIAAIRRLVRVQRVAEAAW
ncbi:MAG TPA: MFS transporter [Gemmatimonadaceae bacterium]